MIRVFRSPRARSVAAATTPGRLAREFGGAVWRERPDGSLEVATMRDRRIDRYVVEEDGNATLVESREPTPIERRANRLAIASWGLLMAGIVTAGASGSNDAGVALGVSMFFLGFALFWYFGSRSAKADDLTARVKEWVPGDWHEPTDLQGWTPHSAEQLATVEQLAEEGDGVAFVRDSGAHTVDVVALRKGRLEIHWVDDLGRTGATTLESQTRSYQIDRVLKKAAGVLWLAILAVVVAVTHHKFLLAGLLVGSLAVLMFIGSRVERGLSLERHVKQLERDGQPWIEIRTRVVEDDGGE